MGQDFLNIKYKVRQDFLDIQYVCFTGRAEMEPGCLVPRPSWSCPRRRYPTARGPSRSIHTDAVDYRTWVNVQFRSTPPPLRKTRKKILIIFFPLTNQGAYAVKFVFPRFVPAPSFYFC